MQVLIEKEKHNVTSKPDFNQKTGRELWAMYLRSKFRQIIEHDQKSETPIIKTINSNFAKTFFKRLVENPKKHLNTALLTPLFAKYISVYIIPFTFFWK